MRVCFLTHYFPPEVGAPQTRIHLLARTLAARGAEVIVHTTFPHYPSGVISPPYRNRPWQQERHDGIDVIRSAVYPAANRGFAGRLLNHASFATSALLTSPVIGGLDVVVAETPPLFTAAAGAGYARLKRAAFVVHIADRWPASAVELGALRNHAAIRAAEALEAWIYRHSDVIAAPTAGIVTALAEHPDARAKVRRVWPVVDLDRFDSTPPTNHRGPLRLMFAGTVGLAHGLDVLVEASRLAGAEVVQTTIAGDGADWSRVRALVQQHQLDNVQMVGTLAADQIPSLYAQSDAAAVLLRDLPIFRGALPTKLLEAMAAGRPLLLGASGESAQLVEQVGCGIVVRPGDPAALADAIARLHGDPGAREAFGRAGRSYAESHFGTARAAEQWMACLQEAIAIHRGS